MIKKTFYICICAVIILLAAFCNVHARQALSGRRDPFVPLVGMAREATGRGLTNVFTVNDIRFEGIASSPSGEKALILNGDIISEGETIGLVEVVNVGNNTAEITVDGVPHTIALYE